MSKTRTINLFSIAKSCFSINNQFFFRKNRVRNLFVDPVELWNCSMLWAVELRKVNKPMVRCKKSCIFVFIYGAYFGT